MNAQPSRVSASGPLPLLCALGRHRTDLLVQWNDGYYFTQCRRCGLDLVRTAFSGWMVPKGYRVVWQAGSAQGDGAVQLVHERAVAKRHGVVGNAASRAESDSIVLDLRSDRADGGEGSAGQVEFPLRDPETFSPPQDMIEEAFAARPADDSQPDDVHADEGTQPPVPLSSADLTGEDQPSDDDERSLDDAIEIEAPSDVGETQALASEAPDTHGRADAIESDVKEAQDQETSGHGARDQQAPPSSMPPAQARKRYPVIPDFMDEEFPGITWDPSTGRMIEGAERPSATGAREAKPGWREAVRDRAQAATASGLEFIRPRRPVETLTGAERPVVMARADEPSRSFIERQGGIVAATIFGSLVVIAAIVDARSTGPAQTAGGSQVRGAAERLVAPPRPMQPRSASGLIAGGDQAFVTANLLNCRAVPRNDGETVRRLSLGDPVSVIGAEPGWVRIAHRGLQCWASNQYISTVNPV